MYVPVTFSVLFFFVLVDVEVPSSEDVPFTDALLNALRTALMIPFELNVAPLTASTFVLCFFTINGSRIPFARLKYAASSWLSNILITLILLSLIVTDTLTTP